MDRPLTGDPIRDLDVLIIDDATSVRRKLRGMLEEANIPTEHIREAASARDGFETFKEDPADLVLLDLVLPDLPGEEIGSALMDEHPETALVPVTALDTGDRRVRRLVSLGALEVLSKPLRREDLDALIGALRERGHSASGST